MFASQNSGSGVQLTGVGASLTESILANNGRGLRVTGDGAVYAGISAVGNQNEGVYVDGPGTTGINVLSASGFTGLLAISGQGHVIHDWFSGETTDLDIELQGATVSFQGNFVAGAGGLVGGCEVGLPAAGLDDASTPLCTLEAPSTATTMTGIPFSIAGDLVGRQELDDTVNTSDIDATGDPDVITDWTGFESPTIAWGVDTLSFPDDSLRGVCDGVETCRMYDWALRADALPSRPPLTHGDTTVIHDWEIAAADQLDCDALRPGSVFDVDTCKTTALAEAFELLDDDVGNDNGLCESNETCLWMWHWGGYQGHGDVVDAGAFTDGAVTGVTLLERMNHGY